MTRTNNRRYWPKPLRRVNSLARVSLSERLIEARADIRQGVDPSLLERERSLQQSLKRKAEREMGLLGGKPSKEDSVTLAKRSQN
jgi:hypothetical protein